jgi:hypothetical protein
MLFGTFLDLWVDQKLNCSANLKYQTLEYSLFGYAHNKINTLE